MAGAGELVQGLLEVLAGLVRGLSDGWQARHTPPEPAPEPERESTSPGAASDSARARSSAPPAGPRSRPR